MLIYIMVNMCAVEPIFVLFDSNNEQFVKAQSFLTLGLKESDMIVVKAFVVVIFSCRRGLRL